MRLRPHLSIAAVLALFVGGPLAHAQDWSLDTKALDPSLATAKKGKPQGAAKQDEPSDKKGKAENRQFGELEGWSPGKSPPKKKDEDKGSRFGGGGKAPVSMTPSGGMSVGMPF